MIVTPAEVPVLKFVIAPPLVVDDKMTALSAPEPLILNPRQTLFEAVNSPKR